jgi:DNA-binding transcriptional MerR regulator
MDRISQPESKSSPFSFDGDDGFLLGIDVDIPQLRPSTAVETISLAEPISLMQPAPVEVVKAEPAELPDTKPALETVQIPDKLYFRIGDVADLAGVKPYVLRYWESEFPMISPDKSTTGQRVYRRSDVEMILLIKHLLYQEKYSIEGARKRIQEVRREGQLKAFKQDKVYGGHEVAVMRERQKQAIPLLVELESLARLPIRELFRY